MNWNKVKNLEIEPPIKPIITDKFDIENFNRDVINEKPRLSELEENDRQLIENNEGKFCNF